MEQASEEATQQHPDVNHQVPRFQITVLQGQPLLQTEFDALCKAPRYQIIDPQGQTRLRIKYASFDEERRDAFRFNAEKERRDASRFNAENFMKDPTKFPALIEYFNKELSRNQFRRNATMNDLYSSSNTDLSLRPLFACAQPVRGMGLEEFNTFLLELKDQFLREKVLCSDEFRHLRMEDEYKNYVDILNYFWKKQAHESYSNTVQVDTLVGEFCLGSPQTSSQTMEALIDGGGVRHFQVQFQNDTPAVDVEAQIIEPNLGPFSMTDPVGLEVGHSGDTNHQISRPEHNTGNVQDDTAVDVEAQIDPSFPALQISPPEGPEQISAGDIVDLILGPNRSNRIRRLFWLAVCNILSNTTVAVYNLPGDLEGVHDTFWRAQLIASVGIPIGVGVFTFLSSFRFASDQERWSNWITGLSSVNAGMIGGGPLGFYFMRNRGTAK